MLFLHIINIPCELPHILGVITQRGFVKHKKEGLLAESLSMSHLDALDHAAVVFAVVIADAYEKDIIKTGIRQCAENAVLIFLNQSIASA